MSKMGMTLEIELGITGGERKMVLTTLMWIVPPTEEVSCYEELSKISPKFTIAAALEMCMEFTNQEM
jgi:fructose-bisphosphate aldolase class II